MSAMSMTDKNINFRSTENNQSIIFVGAIGGFSTGFIFMFAGLILSLIRLLDHVSFHGWEVILIAAAFPLLAVGAHCLDLIEKRKKTQKRESVKQILQGK